MLSFNAPNSPLAERLSDVQLLRKRAAAILWVKSQMANHSIAIDGLVAAGCFAATTPATSQKVRPFASETLRAIAGMPTATYPNGFSAR